MEEYCTAGQATEDNMAHVRFILDTYGYKDTLTICNIIAFPLRQRLHEQPHCYAIQTLPAWCIPYDFQSTQPTFPSIRRKGLSFLLKHTLSSASYELNNMRAKHCSHSLCRYTDPNHFQLHI